MNGTVFKVARIGNSRGIRLPAALLRKYQITDSLIVEEKPDKIELRALRPKHRKLTWEATAEAMAAAHENWSEWEVADADGLQDL
jgi:antitoxin MazE